MATTIGTLKYRLTQIKKTRDPDVQQKWYARAVQDRTAEFEDFVTHMADHNSPYSRGGSEEHDEEWGFPFLPCWVRVHEK